MESSLRQAYLVCATPRSGSTLLCETLRQTGRAGRPLEHFEKLRHSSLPRQPREYLEGVRSPEALELLAPLQPGSPSAEPAEAWWARILAEGKTENGVWGGKLMWGHVEDFLSRARELPGLTDANLETVLRTLLGNPQMILVTRRDKVAQAVSLWRAVQTQAWRSEGAGDGKAASSGEGGAKPRSVVYNFDAINHLAVQLERDERAWSDWFTHSRVRPNEITYDELDVAPTDAVSRVLQALGLTNASVPSPPMARQRDELSSAWRERYLRDRALADQPR